MNKSPSATRRSTRRTVVAGAAWTLPVAAMAVSAPAFAASPFDCTAFFVPPFPRETTSGNGWTVTEFGGDSAGGPGDAFNEFNRFITYLDPPYGTTRIVKASCTIGVLTGKTYTFNYNYVAVLDMPNPMTSVLRVNGVDVPGSLLDTATLPPDPTVPSRSFGSKSVSWTATTTGLVTLEFVHTVTGAPNDFHGDDYEIWGLTGTCA